MKLQKLSLVMVGVQALLLSTAAHAQATLKPVEVRESQQDLSPNLTEKTGAASRLGLSIKDTPASVDVITQEQMEQRGARTFEEALRGGVGMSAGGNPGSPSIGSTRGFTGGFISYLYDGSRISSAGMASRPQDTFNYERIEILKGPASVLYGEGAIGGVVNFVTKRPDRNNPSKEAMVSYGSFNTLRAGAGLGVNIGQDSALRVDFSHMQTDGHIERNKQRLNNLTLGFATKLARDVKLDLSVDYLSDSASSYWGSVLVPATFALQPTNAVTDSTGRVIDRRLAFKNYNVDDGIMRNDSLWTRAKLQWDINPDWTLRNELSYYTADRLWRNSETYSFAAPNLLNRSLTSISHDHQVLSNRLDLTNTSSIGGMKNKFVAGLEYTSTTFGSERRFSNGSAATNAALRVDILNPVYGNYSENPAFFTGAGNRTNFATKIPVVSLFAEDALSVTDKLTLVAGIRTDSGKIDRNNLDLNTNLATAFSQSYNATSTRLGAVYAFDKDTSVYAQYTDAVAPVGGSNLLLLSAVNSAFKLSKGVQTEIGFKQSAFGGQLDYTVSVYNIKLSNILSRNTTLPALVVNTGSQSSNGVELAAAWRATKQLSVSGNYAVVNAKFDSLLEAGGVSRAGNKPPNVPNVVANLWVDYKLSNSPLKVGMGLNHTGEAFTGNDNLVKLNARTTADAYANWDFKPGVVSVRVRNLTNKLYATWGGSSAANQVMVAAPRSLDVSYRVAF
jgi:iron complex outermembrane receptor protein